MHPIGPDTHRAFRVGFIIPQTVQAFAARLNDANLSRACAFAPLPSPPPLQLPTLLVTDEGAVRSTCIAGAVARCRHPSCAQVSQVQPCSRHSQSAKAVFNCPSTSPTSATAPLLCCGNSLSCALTSIPLSFACSPASATPTTRTPQIPSSFSLLLIPPTSPFGRPSGAPCLPHPLNALRVKRQGKRANGRAVSLIVLPPEQEQLLGPDSAWFLELQPCRWKWTEDQK